MRLAAILFSLALAGCTTGMSYHPWNSHYQLGYNDTQLSETLYRVSYTGYYIPQSQTDDYALMRAAEIAKARGYKYFQVTSQSQSNQPQAYMIPGATQTTGTVSGGRVYATSYSSPAFVGTISQPTSTFVVEMQKTPGPTSIDAELAWNSLSKKYGDSK